MSNEEEVTRPTVEFHFDKDGKTFQTNISVALDDDCIFQVMPMLALTFASRHVVPDGRPSREILIAVQRYAEARVAERVGMKVGNPDGHDDLAKENQYAFMAKKRIKAAGGAVDSLDQLDALAEEYVATMTIWMKHHNEEMLRSTLLPQAAHEYDGQLKEAIRANKGGKSKSGAALS